MLLLGSSFRIHLAFTHRVLNSHSDIPPIEHLLIIRELTCNHFTHSFGLLLPDWAAFKSGNSFHQWAPEGGVVSSRNPLLFDHSSSNRAYSFSQEAESEPITQHHLPALLNIFLTKLSNKAPLCLNKDAGETHFHFHKRKRYDRRRPPLHRRTHNQEIVPFQSCAR